MSTYLPMSEQEYRAIINRQYRLPTQLELAHDRLTELRIEREWRAFDADDRPIRSPRYCRLPAMISRLERRIEALEREAVRLGMVELLTNPQLIDKAWDEAIRDAQDDARRNGDSIGFGDSGQ